MSEDNGERTAAPRFSGIKTFMGLPHSTQLEGIDFAVIGIPLDAATNFRTGARFGPEAIRSMSATVQPFSIEQDVDVFDVLRGVDYGDLPVVPGYVTESYAEIEAGLTPVIEAGCLPVILGGDHSITLPALRTVVGRYGPLALVHFDAHTDTKHDHFGQAYGHGTPFRRAAEEGLVVTDASIQVGIRGTRRVSDDIASSEALGYAVITSDEARALGPQSLGDRIRDRVGNHLAFLTYDIDVIDPAYAPGTGSPVVAGLTSTEALSQIRALSGVEFIGFDIVEVLPAYDHAGITALLAASLALEMLALVAIHRSPASP